MDGHSQNNGNNGDANSGNGGDGKGGDGGSQNQNQNGAGNQQQQQQQGNQGGDSNVDLTKLTEDQLAQVMENPNFWKLNRVQKLVGDSKQLEDLQKQQKADEDKRLEDQKEFEKLAETRKSELEEKDQTIQNLQINQALTNKLVPEGVVDLEAAIQLIDRSKIKIEDNGQVTGVDDAIKSLKEGKAYLFNNSGNDQSLGSSSNGGNQQGGNQQQQQTKFKRSQLQDPKFYKDNRDAILEAMRNGQIEDDLSS